MSSVRLLYITHRRSRGGRQIGDLADRPRLDGTGAIVGELTHRKQESEGVFGRAPQVHCPKRKRISPPNHLICPRANIRLTTQASARGRRSRIRISPSQQNCETNPPLLQPKKLAMTLRTKIQQRRCNPKEKFSRLRNETQQIYQERRRPPWLPIP